MLGRYENFPEIIHGVARFASPSPKGEVQQAILSVLHQLNRETCGLSAVTSHSEECEVGFDFGVAKGVEFSFLDMEELGRLQKSIAEREVQMLDFFCVIRYYVVKDGGKRVPLKFDYHMLRFVFQGNSIELRIRHERGTQRVPLEDLVTFLTKRINQELSQKQLEPLTLEYLRTL